MSDHKKGNIYCRASYEYGKEQAVDFVEHCNDMQKVDGDFCPWHAVEGFLYALEKMQQNTRNRGVTKEQRAEIDKQIKDLFGGKGGA